MSHSGGLECVLLAGFQVASKDDVSGARTALGELTLILLAAVSVTGILKTQQISIHT